MPTFADYHGLPADQAQLDFVNVSNEYDLPVYVDPYAIEIRSDDWSNQAAETVRNFFGAVLIALKDGRDEHAHHMMSQLSEPKETFLGQSKGRPRGRGVGSFQASQLIEAIKNSKAYKTGRLEDLSELALYVEGINRDKVSDLTTNLIRHHLVDYTQNQCDLLGVETERYIGPPLWNDRTRDWESRAVQLPRIQNDPVLLVPKVIVRRNLSLNADEFYQKQILDFLQAEHLSAHSSLTKTVRGRPNLTTVKKGKAKRPSKEELKKHYPKSRSFIAEMVEDHPGLLDLYKRIAAERKELVNTSEGDPSLSEVCVLLSEKLKKIPAGPAAADEYHNTVQGIITALFYPDLAIPKKEWEINDGRRRIDIVYMNDAREGFLQQRRDDQNTRANTVIVECKNYSKDIANPEIDQLLGRFDRNRGYFGWILCRTVDDHSAVQKKCRDYATSGRAYIMVITDEDLHRWLDAKANLNDQLIHRGLMIKFRDLIS